MYVGKTLFAQVMEFVPWTSFARIVQRYIGQRGRAHAVVRRAVPRHGLRAADLAREPARHRGEPVGQCDQALRMGFRSAVKRSTLADANESARLAHLVAIWPAVLIRRARKLYANDRFGVELDNTVYALDSSTIDLCLSLFDWAPFRSTKAAIKLHTLLDLRGAIPAFIHISDGKLHDVNVLDMLALEAGAFYVMDRGYVDFARLVHAASGRRLLRHPCQVAAWTHGACTRRPPIAATGVICDQRVMLNGFYSAKKYPEHLRRIRFKDPESGKTLVFLTNNTALPALTIARCTRAAGRSSCSSSGSSSTCASSISWAPARTR